MGRGNQAEEVHLQNMGKLSCLDLEQLLNIAYNIRWDELRGWHSIEALFARVGPVGIWIEVDFALHEFGLQEAKVSRISQSVEALIWILNCQLGDCGIGDA